jgi:hypothetical protein
MRSYRARIAAAVAQETTTRRTAVSAGSTVLVMAHLVSVLVLVGVIWTVQVVHYPLMALVGEDRFRAYEAAHAPRMAAVVMLPWVIQGITTVGLLLSPPAGVPDRLVLAAAVTAAVPVLVTVVASVPAHAHLSLGFDAAAHRRLVRTNWLRTAAWTAHAPIAVAILLTAG